MRGANEAITKFRVGRYIRCLYVARLRRRLPEMHATTERPISIGWGTPAVVAACGCLIASIRFCPASPLGFLLRHLSETNHWGRDVVALAVAIQNLLWGIGQPFAGAIADRFGTNRV